MLSCGFEVENNFFSNLAKKNEFVAGNVSIVIIVCYILPIMGA